MLPSVALANYLLAHEAAERWGLTPVVAAEYTRHRARDLDQAIYDMAHRAHLGLPMVDEPRKKRGG